MRRALMLCEKAAQFNSNILLQGESGEGKERFAEYIFEKSYRNNKAFIKISDRGFFSTFIVDSRL